MDLCAKQRSRCKAWSLARNVDGVVEPERILEGSRFPILSVVRVGTCAVDHTIIDYTV